MLEINAKDYLENKVLVEQKLQELKEKSIYEGKDTVVDNLLPYVKFDNLVKVLFKKKLGRVLINEVNDCYEYAILIDVGLFYLNMTKGEVCNLFGNASKEKVLKCYENFDKNVNQICATTFFFFTNIPAKRWFDSTSLINQALESYPCYNAMQLSAYDLDEEEIDQDNETRSFILYSSMKAKRNKEKEQKRQDEDFDQEDDVFYFNKLVKKEGIDNYFVYEIQRFPELVEVYDDNRNETTSIIMPITASFKELKGLKREKITLTGFELKDENSLYFTSKIGGSCEAYCYDGIKFNEFYSLEAKCDLFHVHEGVRIHDRHQNIFFWSKDYSPKYVNHITRRDNDYEAGEIYEDKMIADIYTVIPFRYENREILKEKQCMENNFIVNNLITGLRFQENYEFGNENHNVRKYQDRIKRYDLGTVNVIICEDRHYNYYYKCPTEIIENTPIPVRLIMACDKDTHTAVLYLLNFSVKSYPTGYLDEVSRNDILIELEPGYEHLKKGIAYGDDVEIPYMSLYTFLKEKYKIYKSGLPRHLVISPYLDDEDEICKNLPTEMQAKVHEKFLQIKSSIMYAETVFEDEEELGKVIDPEVKEILNVPFGISIYDYAKSYISRQILLLYADTFKDYLAERIDFAVVDLFYVELICLEDAAIQISTYSISKFINNYNVTKQDGKRQKKINPSSVLAELDAIEEEYAKTLDLWDVQMNYSSSKIFLSKMREAFEIEQSINRLQRNKDEISTIYSSKNAKVTGRFAIIISFVTIILTAIQIFQLYIDGYKDVESGDSDTQFSFVEILILKNFSIVEIMRVGLVVFLIVVVVRYIYNQYMTKIIAKLKNKI